MDVQLLLRWYYLGSIHDTYTCMLGVSDSSWNTSWLSGQSHTPPKIFPHPIYSNQPEVQFGCVPDIPGCIWAVGSPTNHEAATPHSSSSSTASLLKCMYGLGIGINYGIVQVIFKREDNQNDRGPLTTQAPQTPGIPNVPTSPECREMDLWINDSAIPHRRQMQKQKIDQWRGGNKDKRDDYNGVPETGKRQAYKTEINDSSRPGISKQSEKRKKGNTNAVLGMLFLGFNTSNA